MDWQAIFFSFGGRLNRAKFWLVLLIGTIICNVGQFAAGIVAAMLAQLDASQSGPAAIAVLVAPFALYAWITSAAGVKRLHDREKSGWWILPFWIAPHALFFIGLMALPGNAGVANLLASLVLLLWWFVELGCLKGTTGPNTYGTDPLPAAAAA